MDGTQVKCTTSLHPSPNRGSSSFFFTATSVQSPGVDRRMKGSMRGVDIREDGINEISIKDLSRKLEEFAQARDWVKYHSPRNLLLAMVGEVGELSEIFQWKGEVARGLPNWDESDKEHLAEELSDVLLYLIRLSDICDIDLGEAALSKLVKNAIKYPVQTL